ncbi:MAG: hypothetical protein AB7U46_11815 [Paenirhodobacter sp.]|uniref:hypothetical protein n=1 Tax=Paenirhodobacter sp. TaxID=1965326 RepID=UPI003D1315D6
MLPRNDDIRWPMQTALLLILAGLWIQLRTLARARAMGGEMWLQGDWLINLAAGPIRRGPMGSAFLWLSDRLGLAPLDAVVIVQAVLSLALFGGTALLLRRQNSPASVLAVVSAGFFPLLWGVDPISGLRKELFGLLALLLLVWPATGPRRSGLIALSALLLAIGAVGHEALVLFFPAWLIALFLLRGDTPITVLVLSALLLGLALLGAGGYALMHARLGDASPLCTAIRQRGPVSEHFCAGAIGWLADPENGPAKVRAALARNPALWSLPLAALAAIAPLARLWWLCGPRDRRGWALIAAGLPFTLLYPIGLDWGRWLALQVSVASLLWLGLGARGALRTRGLSAREFVLWLALALCVGIAHGPVVIPFGFLHGLVRSLI